MLLSLLLNITYMHRLCFQGVVIQYDHGYQNQTESNINILKWTVSSSLSLIVGSSSSTISLFCLSFHLFTLLSPSSSSHLLIISTSHFFCLTHPSTSTFSYLFPLHLPCSPSSSSPFACAPHLYPLLPPLPLCSISLSHRSHFSRSVGSDDMVF